MDLITEVKQKNNQLLLRRVELQQCLAARINTPYFSSFVITFVAAPFLAGVIIYSAIKPSKALLLPLSKALSLPLFRALFTLW